MKKLITAIHISASVASLSFASPTLADTGMARNVILTSTGAMLSERDAKVQRVSAQLDRIAARCAATSRGAEIGDKVAFAYSKLKTHEDFYVYLDGVDEMTGRQCRRLDDSTLLSVYVLERNEGASHRATIKRVSDNPDQLVRKWSSRPSQR